MESVPPSAIAAAAAAGIAVTVVVIGIAAAVHEGHIVRHTADADAEKSAIAAITAIGAKHLSSSCRE